MFRILIERNAEKDLAGLSKEVHGRIVKAISKLSTEPRPAGSKKLSGNSGDWRIRVGDYRVIYDIADTVRVVRVIRVRHRRDVYR